MGREGRIVRVNQANVIDGYPVLYRAQTVFACSPLLPMIVTDGDASLGYTFPRRICSCNHMYDNEKCSTWSHLHFGGSDDNARREISYVNSYASGDPFVAGKDPTWVPSLVPSVYRNTKPSAGPSRGLSGELPIILALMGFHGKPGRASDIFRDRKWNLGQWVGSNRASSYRVFPPSCTSCRYPANEQVPKSGESPRGLFVQVCADNLVGGQEDCEENNIPVEVWEQALQDLEYRTILVQG